MLLLSPLLQNGLWPAAAAETATADKADGQTVVPQDHTVDVWGRGVHVRVYPGDGRTILLEAGAGLDASEWDALAPHLAATTGATVISYDRAGKGKSAPLEHPYNVHDEMARLHGALYSLGYRGKLVLTGHSYGGFLIQVYANMYPGDVSGMVFIDANTVRGIATIGVDKLQQGLIKRNDVPEATASQKSLLRMGRAYRETFEIVSRLPVVCGVPVAVITAGKTTPGIDPKIIEDWQGGHADIVAQTGGQHFRAAESGHMIPRDQPAIVIEAIASVLEAASGRDAALARPGAACPQ
jgi:pimeloyl-ACP methyl ester carboxylesterase